MSGTTVSPDRILIRGAHLISVDPLVGEVPSADILIEDGKIARISPCSDDAIDAEVIDAAGKIAIPGFVDTHRHTWQSLVRHIATDWTLGQYFTGIHFGLSALYRPEDTEIANLLGALEAVNAGVTTLLDWSHNLETPAHADGAIAGLRDSGIRGVFGHGGGATMWAVPNAVPHSLDVERIQREHFGGGTTNGLLTLAFAARGPQFTPGQTASDDILLARRLGLRITMHVGDGEWGRSRPVEVLHANGLTGDDITYVHCNTLSGEELMIIADTGGTASVAADVESQMGHGWPATGRLLEAGIRPSLSIDVCSSTSGDMFGAMKTTISLQRALDNSRTENADGRAGVALECADVIEFATLRGAIATGLAHEVGSISVGKAADIVLLDTHRLETTPLNNAVGAVVYSGHVGLVDTVLIDGRIVKLDGRLTRPDLETVLARATRARDELFERAQRQEATASARLGGAWKPAAVSAS